MVDLYHDKVFLEALEGPVDNNIDDDYSITEGVFEYVATKALQINKIIFRIKCADFLSDGFGSGSALTTTMTLAKEASNDDVLLDLTYGVDIVDNDDMLLLVDNDLALGGKNFIGSSYLSINTAPMKLVAGEKITARFNDDMTTRVDNFNILVNGVFLA